MSDFNVPRLNVTDITASGTITGNKGIVIPYVTSANRPGSPTVGTIIYNTDENSQQVWTGSTWKNVGASNVLPTWADSTARPTGILEGYIGFNIGTSEVEVFEGISDTEVDENGDPLALWRIVDGVGGGGDSGAAPLFNWSIIMRSNADKTTTGQVSGNADWGYPGSSSFLSINGTSSSTNANSRTAFGQAPGLYKGFFQKRNITRIAYVSGTGTIGSPTTNSHYLVYDLVESTGTESIYEILVRLDAYNLSNNWGNTDAAGFTSPSVTNFTGGSGGYSGTLSQSGGGWTDNAGNNPDRFALWGINTDSDDDTQVMVSFSGNLGSGKMDSWRGSNASQTFWSYWGQDWHSTSSGQTISVATQTNPGPTDSSNAASQDVYVIAYGTYLAP